MIADTQNIKDLEQWLCWRTEERDGKPTKVPYGAVTGQRASSTNPDTWTSYQEALTACKDQDYDGIGFVVTPRDDLCGVDLDNCLDPESGEIESWAQEIIEELNSYTEISPSGTGVHIYVRGTLPPGRNREGDFEAYDCARYFTVTGKHLAGTPKNIESRQTQLEEVTRRVFGDRSAPNTNGHRAPVAASRERSDAAVIGKARSESNGKFDRLFQGDISDYPPKANGAPDHSAADDGFVHKLFSYTQDEEQIKRIHAISGLHRPEKSGKRADYLQRSIDRARKNVTWFYEWSSKKTVNLAHGNAEPLPWPVLAEEAFFGLPGDVVRTIAPHTEADPVAVLANLLCFFGNAVGRGTWFRVGADLHHLKINAALVGTTSKGRKGMSEGHVRELMHAVETLWSEERIANGLSSGEGLIHEVRDPVWGLDSDGAPVLKDAGAEDKRLLVSEPELARVLKVMTRETNTLSPIIRQCWDGGRLRVMTRTNPLKSTDAHVSIVGHISKEELLRHLSETEAASGFANRFLFLLVRRSKELPFGGGWSAVDTAPLAERLSDALEFAQSAGELAWGVSAKDAWRAVYGSLSEGKPGLFGAVVGRAEAQAVRLASLYAVMDQSATIESEHLEAALALWDYAEKSALYIFGDATGDPVADDIAEALKAAGDNGLSRTEIRDLFGRHKSADRINGALGDLLKLGRLRKEDVPTGGRPTERWFVVT